MARMDLNDDGEKANIETIFWSAMDMLSDDDKKLPQARIFSVTVALIFYSNMQIPLSLPHFLLYYSNIIST